MTAIAIDIQKGRQAVALAKQEWGPNALLPIGPFLTALMPLQPASDLQRRWHVVQTEPQREFRVAEEIDKAGFDAWCPKMPRKVRVRAEHYRKVDRPMLPGYVLAGFDPGHECWEVIRGTQVLHGQRMEGMRHVLRLLMIELRPVPLGDNEVYRLASREAEEASGRCVRVGTTALVMDALVRVLTGPFSGFLGVIVEMDLHRQTVAVEIDIFGRKTPVTLDDTQVEAV